MTQKVQQKEKDRLYVIFVCVVPPKVLVHKILTSFSESILLVFSRKQPSRKTLWENRKKSQLMPGGIMSKKV
jgi:hypothetical protein